MTGKLLRRRLAAALALGLLALAALGGATYAWFSANRTVAASRVTAHTAERTVRLLLSSRGGASFDGAEEAELVPLGGSTPERLMPVSTAELRSFVTCAATNARGEASAFRRLEGDRDLLHCRLYLLAEAENSLPGSTVAVYLDLRGETEPLLLCDDPDSALPSAARLGLLPEGGEAQILRLQPEPDDASRSTGTVLNGATVPPGFVIDSSGPEPAAAADPARLPWHIAVTDDADMPDVEPLLALEPGVQRALDVYFYLEGCDPDCTEAVRFEGCSLQLSFFGILEEGP